MCLSLAALCWHRSKWKLSFLCVSQALSRRKHSQKCYIGEMIPIQIFTEKIIYSLCRQCQTFLTKHCSVCTFYQAALNSEQNSMFFSCLLFTLHGSPFKSMLNPFQTPNTIYFFFLPFSVLLQSTFKNTHQLKAIVYPLPFFSPHL